jgi:hypothetical protein
VRTGVIGTLAAWVEHWHVNKLAMIYGASAAASALLGWADWLREKLFPHG